MPGICSHPDIISDGGVVEGMEEIVSEDQSFLLKSQSNFLEFEED